MPTTPTGVITFTDDNAGGTFNPVSCSLSYGNCTATYVTNVDPQSSITIYASYAGDSTHIGSQSTLQVSTGLTDRTLTTVSPSSLSFLNAQQITVSAIVIDTVNPSASLIGMVTFNDGNQGGTFSSNSCILTGDKCTVTYTTPSIASTGITLTATYAGDSNHSSSTATAYLNNLGPVSNSTPIQSSTGMANCFNAGGSWNPTTQSCSPANTSPAPVAPVPYTPQVTTSQLPAVSPLTTVSSTFSQIVSIFSTIFSKL